jgi:hypothetical protein
MNVANKPFMLQVDADCGGRIVSAISSPISTVAYKLAIRCYNGPEGAVWYKDEGGKDNCIEFYVYLENDKNENAAIKDNKSVFDHFVCAHVCACDHCKHHAAMPASHMLIDKSINQQIEMRCYQLLDNDICRPSLYASHT